MRHRTLGTAITHPLPPRQARFYSSLCNMAGSMRNRKRGASQLRTTRTRPEDSSTPSSWPVRKSLFVAGAIALSAFLFSWISTQNIPSTLRRRWLATPVEEWENRRQQVKDAFVSSWDAYSKYAWGELLPP